MSSARIGLAAVATLVAALVFGGILVTPTARAAITGSQITTPSDPSFFVADEDASAQTFAIAGTTTGGNPATNTVDVNCYSGGSFVTVARSVPLTSDGSFSIAKADLNQPLDLTCRLRAVPAGSNPSDLTPFAGPVIGVGERDSDKVAVGPNAGELTGYYLDAQQKTAAFDYVSLGNCGLDDGYLYDSAFAQTTTTFQCAGALFMADSVTTPTRSEIQIDSANAYDPFSAGQINPNASGLPSLTDTYTVDKATGDVVIHEKDPLVTCPDRTFPPNQVSCPSFASAGVTDNRTITQSHDGHVSSITDSFTSTDDKAHALDLLWDNSQHFWGAGGDSRQVEYEFPGESSFSTRALGDTVTLPSTAGTIFVRMHGAADGDTGTGQGAIVYDRPASSANFNLVQSFASEFTLHQTGSVPSGGSTKFRFAFVQDFRAANVQSLAATAAKASLDTIAVRKWGQGKGTVTSSPRGISCGKACSHGFVDGTAVTLKAKAAAGSRFAGWSGPCTGTHTCKIATDGNVTVKAKFALEPCVVPDLEGETLRAAKLSLAKAFCSLGKVTAARSSSIAKGRVVSEQPGRGKRLKPRAKVNLVLSAG